MSKFKKRKPEMEDLATSSLSDIIFMFLFFFMTVTTMKEVDFKVKFELHKGLNYKSWKRNRWLRTFM